MMDNYEKADIKRIALIAAAFAAVILVLIAILYL